MANVIQRHERWRSEKRGERPGKDFNPRTNPRFKMASRITPAAKHPYSERHPKQTVFGQLFGGTEASNKMSNVRHLYNKEIFTPGKQDLKERRQKEAKELAKHFERKKREIYRPVYNLEDQIERERNPRRLERLERDLTIARHRADEKYDWEVYQTERQFETDYRLAERKLFDDRDKALADIRREDSEKRRQEEDTYPLAA